MFLLPADGTGILLLEDHIPSPLILTSVALALKNTDLPWCEKKRSICPLAIDSLESADSAEQEKKQRT